MTTNPTIRRVLRAVALTGAAATLAVVALQAPAAATYYANIWGCGDPCGYAKSDTPNEDMLYVCDTHPSGGSFVYGEFHFQDGKFYGFSDWSVGGGCAFMDWRPTPYYTVALKAQDDTGGRWSGWVYTDGLGGN